MSSTSGSPASHMRWESLTSCLCRPGELLCFECCIFQATTDVTFHLTKEDCNTGQAASKSKLSRSKVLKKAGLAYRRSSSLRPAKDLNSLGWPGFWYQLLWEIGTKKEKERKTTDQWSVAGSRTSVRCSRNLRTWTWWKTWPWGWLTKT